MFAADDLIEPPAKILAQHPADRAEDQVAILLDEFLGRILRPVPNPPIKSRNSSLVSFMRGFPRLQSEFSRFFQFLARDRALNRN